jgi:hypothetical protein
MFIKLYPRRSGPDGRYGSTEVKLIALLDNDHKHLKFLPHSAWLLEFIAQQEIMIPDEQYTLLVDNYSR